MNTITRESVTNISWFEATARERISSLLDKGSFAEFLGPTERQTSPHLGLFDLPVAFDDGAIIGCGKLGGHYVLLAAQEGRFMGGTFGEVHGAKVVGLLRAARDAQEKPDAVLLLMDTGGVRLEEANVGELAVSEVIRAVLETRAAGVPVIALVGGRAGCFGGGGIIAATCSRIAVSEQGRIGVTGPEVIETNKGVEEFDAEDRPLVWRTVGGKNRRLIGGADSFTEDTIDSFRQAALSLISCAPAFDQATLAAEQKRLEQRLEKFGSCNDATDMWRILGIDDPKEVADLPPKQFIEIAQNQKEANHEAR